MACAPELADPFALTQLLQALALALADANIAKFVTGEPKKVIFVPGRLLNLVV
ncbi:MAG TPA: hypothetical protein VFY16_04245 [Gemmatimonadaceae bacterium]|nr:hypothetical protein [Gemmatimonadaceae bacterium]